MTQRLPLTVYMVIVPKAILQWYVYREYGIHLVSWYFGTNGVFGERQMSDLPRHIQEGHLGDVVWGTSDV